MGIGVRATYTRTDSKTYNGGCSVRPWVCETIKPSGPFCNGSPSWVYEDAFSSPRSLDVGHTTHRVCTGEVNGLYVRVHPQTRNLLTLLPAFCASMAKSFVDMKLFRLDHLLAENHHSWLTTLRPQTRSILMISSELHQSMTGPTFSRPSEL